MFAVKICLPRDDIQMSFHRESPPIFFPVHDVPRREHKEAAK